MKLNDHGEKDHPEHGWAEAREKTAAVVHNQGDYGRGQKADTFQTHCAGKETVPLSGCYRHLRTADWIRTDLCSNPTSTTYGVTLGKLHTYSSLVNKRG